MLMAVHCYVRQTCRPYGHQLAVEYVSLQQENDSLPSAAVVRC